MNVTLCHFSRDEYEWQVLMAFAQGIQAAGDNAFFSSNGAYTPLNTDVLVVFKNRTSNAQRILVSAYEAAGKRVLMLGPGFVRRDEYYAAGWDGAKGHADYMHQNMPIDRWVQLDTPLEMTEQPARGPWIVVGQVPYPGGPDYVRWMWETVDLMHRRMDQAEVIVRPHPSVASTTPLILGADRSEGALSADLQRARGIITFSSNVGVEAVIAGVPTYAADSESMVYGIAAQIAGATFHWAESREQWAADLAYAQWTKEEMMMGKAWEHLRPGVLIKQESA